MQEFWLIVLCTLVLSLIIIIITLFISKIINDGIDAYQKGYSKALEEIRKFLQK